MFLYVLYTAFSYTLEYSRALAFRLCNRFYMFLPDFQQQPLCIDAVSRNILPSYVQPIFNWLIPIGFAPYLAHNIVACRRRKQKQRAIDNCPYKQIQNDKPVVYCCVTFVWFSMFPFAKLNFFTVKRRRNWTELWCAPTSSGRRSACRYVRYATHSLQYERNHFVPWRWRKQKRILLIGKK